MSLPVDWIIELIGPDSTIRLASGELFGQASGETHVLVRIAIGRGWNFDQFGAKQAQGVLLFLALRFGDNDDSAIAKRFCNHREPNAGIASRAFDNNPAGFQQPSLFRIANNIERCPVLHRLTGIEELSLAVNCAAGQFGSLLQMDQWRIADCVEHRLEHGIRPSCFAEETMRNSPALQASREYFSPPLRKAKPVSQS